MGKYMRKRRPIGVADGALGVRTRAKAMAELNRESLRPDSRNASRSSSLESRTQLTVRHHQEGLMVLRSRLIFKNSAETCLKIRSDYRLEASVSRSPRLSVNGSRSTQEEVAAPSLTRVTRTASSGVSVSLPTRQAYGILTRRRTQELANRVRQEYDPEIDLGVVSSAPKSSAYCLQASLVDLNATVCAASSKFGTGASCSTRSSSRRDIDAVSTSKLVKNVQDAATFTRTADFPSSSEMNAFFEDAEKEGRERFIERYNFDPTTGTPLAGRYEWTVCEESSCSG